MLLNWDSILLLTPGVLGGFGLLVITRRAPRPTAAVIPMDNPYCSCKLTHVSGLLVITTSRFQHYLTLPACLIAMPALFFFLTVVIGGSTMDELRTDGWIAETTAPEPFYAVWEVRSHGLQLQSL